jgi:uncharacterized protein YbaR (Trm112 family)
VFIELVEAFRCLGPHEVTWLVGSFARLEERDIVSGVLGCSVCRATYPIRDSVLVMAEGPAASPAAPDHDRAMRTAALLGLTEPRGFAVLRGSTAADAHLIAALAPTHLMLLDPPSDVLPADGVSVVRAAGHFPLREQSTRGVALDGTESPAMVAQAVAALQHGGRLVGPVRLPVPAGIRELARDATGWVGERDAVPSGVVSIASRRR